MKQSQNGNRNIHLSRVYQKVPLSALKKWNKNLVDKYMKQKKKKEETKVYEIWPNITVNQLAGKFIMNLRQGFKSGEKAIEASEVTIFLFNFRCPENRP